MENKLSRAELDTLIWILCEEINICADYAESFDVDITVLVNKLEALKAAG